MQLETQTVTLVTREVLSQLTNHRHIQVTFGSDGAALLRLLNMIMLKILDESNLPSIFAALLRAMLSIPDIVTTSGPHQVHCFQALAVKCLTKITKTRLAEEQVRAALCCAVVSGQRLLGAWPYVRPPHHSCCCGCDSACAVAVGDVCSSCGGVAAAWPVWLAVAWDMRRDLQP